MNKTSNLVALLCATAIHSVHRTSRAFVDADGIPTPNVEHYERDRFVCFAEGEGGEGGTGGGTPKTYTQEEVNAINAKTASKIEARLKAEADAREAALRAELEAVKQSVEEAGKSEKEKAELKAQRERATLEQRAAELEKKVAESTQLAERRAAELRDTRVDHELNALLGAHKVIPEAMRFALSGFRQDAKLEYDAEGKVIGVDFADARHTSLKGGVDAWMKANGAIFTPAPPGGAGTRPSTGITGAKNMGEMSASDLAAAVNATETTTASSGR